KTVGAVRENLQTGGEIPHLKDRKGADGKTYPRIVQYIDPSPAGERGIKLAAKEILSRERKERWDERVNDLKNLSDKSAELPTGRKVAILYADPATRYISGFGNRSIENHYRTMSIDELSMLP